MKKKTVAFSRHATNIFFHILTRCNLHCLHCYINPGQHGVRRLSLKTIEAWLDAFSEKAAGANLIFLGGEPTLHPRLPEAVRYARQRGFHSITIDTNGYLFHGVLEKLVPADVDFFSFSLDGATADTNDRIRGRGCYDACLQGVRKAVSRGFGASMIFTVSRLNIRELPDMIPLLETLGVDRFFIQVIGIRGKSTDPGLGRLQIDRKAWEETIPETAEAIARRGITVTYPKVFLSAEEPFECAGRVADNFFVFPNGRVYRCPLCEDYPLHSLRFEDDRLVQMPRINETDLFPLEIREGCVMNRIIQPDNIVYTDNGAPADRIACCMLKEEISLR